MHMQIKIIKKRKLKIIGGLLALALAFIFNDGFIRHALAEERLFSVSPAVIDRKLYARDVVSDKIKIKSLANYKLTLYAFVYNIKPEDGKLEFIDPSLADYKTSLANWILFPRSVIELAPGEEREISFNFDINMRALPGIYHAMLVIAEGPTRGDAEAKIRNSPSVLINLEVLEKIEERMTILKFIPEKNFFNSAPAKFFVELKNDGNTSLRPEGGLKIYNRRGELVEEIKLNAKGEALAPNHSKEFAGLWEGFRNFGRYKALLDLRYGKGKSLQDTVFFWVIPFKEIALAFVILSFLVVLLVMYWHRILLKRYEKAHLSLGHKAGVSDGGGSFDPPDNNLYMNKRVIDLRNKK
jgi:hypothetical protein